MENAKLKAMNGLPVQPIEFDSHGVIRFRSNRIVAALLDVASKHGLDLNQIVIRAAKGEFSDAEQMQLAQLIGYSVSGFGDLNYADERVVEHCASLAQQLVAKQ